MVITVSRTIAVESLGMRPLIRVAAAAAVLTLGACSSDNTETADTGATKSTVEAPAPSSSGLVLGGLQPGGKFKSQGNFAAAPGTPDINTVPTEVPAPPSSKEERAKAIEGLIADRTNARYTDQGGRSQPVAVRPFVDTPEPARTDAVARLDAPAPERPAEPAIPEAALPPPNVIQADVGPRSPGAAPRRGPATRGEADVAAAGGTVSGSTGGFRPLTEFQAAVYSKSTLAGTLALQGGNLSSGDRNVLNATAREQIDSRGKGVIRVIGHGTGGADRAVIAARELQRMGVSRDNLFVGVDNITGPTEVFFDRTK
jgi:hypothetical protein